MTEKKEATILRDAATVLLLKGGARPKIFMVKRNARAAFMANAMVFPGGRLDGSDADPALWKHLSLSPEEAAERMGMTDGSKALGLMVAAIRETFEEAGIFLATGRGAVLDKMQVTGWRQELENEERGFNDLVTQEDLELRVDRLLYVSRWVTPDIESRRFDARFFAVEVPSNTEGEHDHGETIDSAWLAAHEALEAYHEGTIELAPPTLRILESLEANENLMERGRQGVLPPTIQPQPLWDGAVLHLLLPGDYAYDPPGEAPNRISLVERRWVSVGDGA